MSGTLIEGARVCSSCRKPVPEGSQTEHAGAVYCTDCVGEALGRQASRRKESERDPQLAVLLSLLPGLGQMYCGLMTKGLLILGSFMFVVAGPSLGQLQTPTACTLYFWNLFDAYWTAQRINRSELPTPPPWPEEQRWESVTAPAWGVLLILVGAVFLLNNLGVTWMTLDRAWPAVLMGLGIWLLVVFAISRRPITSPEATPQEASDDQSAQG